MDEIKREIDTKNRLIEDFEAQMVIKGELENEV
jgi:hypothetical protein